MPTCHAAIIVLLLMGPAALTAGPSTRLADAADAKAIAGTVSTRPAADAAATQPSAIAATTQCSTAPGSQAATRPVPTVEPIRTGIRCPVTADTEVSFYKGKDANERLWNYGKAERLKLKGFEEYVLMKFDTSACKGMTVRRATLYLPKTDQCDPAVIAPSTISTDWAEGTGKGDPGQDPASGGKDGATALRPSSDRTWAGPDSNLKWVVFGEGGSTYDARATGRAREGAVEYVSVDMPLDVMHGLLVEGDSYGICITEEKGQRGFNKTYIDPPNPNHFVYSHETGKCAFLVVEGQRSDTTPPAPVYNTKAEPGREAGDIVLTWTCTGGDGRTGGRALGYRVYLSTEPLTPKTLNEKTLLSRYRTCRPLEAGQTQVFPIHDLAPGTQYYFAVMAYDEAGNTSEPVYVDGRTRAARAFALQQDDYPINEGSVGEHGQLSVWACPSNCKINPVTGNSLDQDGYTQPREIDHYREGNAVWDGNKHRVALFAGRNDFTGFQLVLQNTGGRPLTGITVRVRGIWQDSNLSFREVDAAKVELFWEWSCRDKDGTYYPDALLPVSGPLSIPNPANVIKGQTVQLLYVDVYVPRQTAPGTYVVALQVEAEGVNPFLVPIDLTVWDFALPDKLSFLSNMYAYNMPQFLGPDQWEGALSMYRLAHRNRLNLKIIPHNHSGGFSNPYMALEARGQGRDRRILSFESFDKYYGPLLTGEAFADCPRKGEPVADVTLPIFENFPCKLAGGFTFDPYGTHLDIRKDFTQDYADGFVAVCGQMAEHFKQKGYTKNTFEVVFRSKYQYAPTTTFWLLDEPMFRDDYLALNYFAHLTRLGFADAWPVKVLLRTDCSRVEEAHGLLNEVDVFQGTMSNLGEYYQPMRDMRRSYVPRTPGQSRTLWVYGATNAVNTSNVTNRCWSIEAWLFGSDAVTPWLAFGSEEAYTKAEAAGEAVFYPAARFGENGVYGSLRMKAFRDGQQDVECLIQLAGKLGATRREMAGLLGKVANLSGQFVIEHPEAADTISYDRVSPDDLVRLRRIIGYNLHLLNSPNQATQPVRSSQPSPAQ